ncbi:MAG TPA: NADH:ubiquinone oxidoreductase [Planctomycetota bacterium]|nr:NADH:ubiquinone oxidoreductase [Planctomycetota bacterium]
MNPKPRVAFFDFTCCEGCQLVFLSQEDALLDLVSHVDIVNFREATSRREDSYDIAFIEGSITTDEDVERLKHIRERAKTLIAFGACSTTGGVNKLRNRKPLDEQLRTVCGQMEKYPNTIPVMAVPEVVTCEYLLHGCPVDAAELRRLFLCLVTGKEFRQPNVPVCFDCRLKENVCLYHKQIPCLGPVTRAGCGAICPSYGVRCDGCRGLIDQPNLNAEHSLLREFGLTWERLVDQYIVFQEGVVLAGDRLAERGAD